VASSVGLQHAVFGSNVVSLPLMSWILFYGLATFTDIGGGVSASCISGPVVCLRGQWMTTQYALRYHWLMPISCQQFYNIYTVRHRLHAITHGTRAVSQAAR